MNILRFYPPVFRASCWPTRPLRVWAARIARSTGRVGHTPSVRAGTSRELGARAARACASQRVLRFLNARSRMALIGGRILDDAGTRRVPNARATQGNQRRSRWSRPYGEGAVKSSAQHMPAQSLPISGCLVPFRRGDAALRTPASARAPEQPVLDVRNQSDGHRP